MLYKMALKIEEFDVNHKTSIGEKSVNGLKFANFRYKNLGEKPWNIKSPLINYGGFYTFRCKT